MIVHAIQLLARSRSNWGLNQSAHLSMRSESTLECHRASIAQVSMGAQVVEYQGTSQQC
jgi:hypothetical protein